MGNTNPTVYCTVDQCTHNMGGKQCMAAKIGIFNNEATGESTTSADTQCKSFHRNKTVGDMVGALNNVNFGGAVKAAFMDGKQLTPAVECYVSNCKYWDSGNYCSASEIHVKGSNAGKTDDTDCETFVSK